MADMSAEEAFLKSMKDMADAEAVQYETKAADEKQTDSTSSDEYDPAQAVPDTFSPRPAQDIPSSPGVVKQSPSIQIPYQPLSGGANVAATGLQDHAVDDDDGRSQSRSMSDSSSSSASPVTIQTNNVLPKMDGPAESSTQETNNLQTPSATAEDAVQIPPSSAIPSPTSASSAVVSHVQSQNDVSVQKLPDVDQNGLAQSVFQSNPSLPDDGREALLESTTETATQAPAPQEPETKTSTMNQGQVAPGAALPKARLPHDKIGILEDRIKEDPRGDMGAWLELISEYRERNKIQDARDTYERFFTVFPAAAEQWIAWIKMENELKDNNRAVEILFEKVLMGLPNLHLWSTYLNHVRRRNDVDKDLTGKLRAVVTAAFELVLNHVGMDKDSGYIWQDYIQFLKSRPGNVGGSTWQEQQKMDQLRKAYHRAIKVPTQATQSLWKEYDQFEMSINKLTGRKFLQEESPAYMTARGSYVALSNITRNLRRTTLPTLPPHLGFDGDREYMEQLNIWKQWILWEKEDPLVLKEGKEEERQQWRDRVVFVYKQSVMDMRFWPELWFDAAQFCFENGMDEHGNEFLVQGIHANPESCLLAFKLADRVELTTTNGEGDDGIARRGAAVREPYNKVLDALYDLIKKTTFRESRDIAMIEAHFAAEANAQPNGNDNDDDENQDDIDSKDKRKATQIEGVKEMSSLQVRLLSKLITSVWTALMRAMRRVQGKGKVGDKIGGARQIFTDARKRGRLTQDIYVTTAMMEYHCYEPEATKKIFERGLKLFPEDEMFALEYIRHLMMTNDAINARVVFETVVNRLTSKPETSPRAKPLYAFFHDFECKYGELTQISKLEKRMKEHFPDDPMLSHFSRRYVQQGFDPTVIRPIISPATQTRPKFPQTTDSTVPPQGSPPSRTAQPNNSPKRPLPFDDSDNEAERPRKLARGESPLKGAAGRRLEQQKRNQPLQGTPQIDHALPLPPPQPLPIAITDLLSALPRKAYYPAYPRFLPGPAVEVMASVSLQNPRRAQEVHNPQQRPPLSMPPRPPQPPPQVPQLSPYGVPQQASVMPPMPPNGMPSHYNGGYSSVPPKFPPSSFPQQHQVPPSPSGPHFLGPNGQMMGHGGTLQGSSYSYGQGNFSPHLCI
ncbi:MAG: hypothetical protein Q9218_005547 [Villophora microphyllina]